MSEQREQAVKWISTPIPVSDEFLREHNAMHEDFLRAGEAIVAGLIEQVAEQLDLDTFESEEGERRPWRPVEDTKPL